MVSRSTTPAIVAHAVEQHRHRRGITTVLVVDDHRTFADLLEGALGREPDLCCVGSAHSAAEALDRVRVDPPDVVVMDHRLGDGDGVSTTTDILAANEQIRVLILTGYAHGGMIQEAARAGACALLPKSGSLPNLLTAIRTASRANFIVDASLLHPGAAARDAARIVPSLSPREDAVLQLLARGMDARTVAKELGIGLSTCRGYVRSLLVKLDAHSQLEAVVVAHSLGLTREGLRRPA